MKYILLLIVLLSCKGKVVEPRREHTITIKEGAPPRPQDTVVAQNIRYFKQGLWILDTHVCTDSLQNDWHLASVYSSFAMWFPYCSHDTGNYSRIISIMPSRFEDAKNFFKNKVHNEKLLNDTLQWLQAGTRKETIHD